MVTLNHLRWTQNSAPALGNFATASEMDSLHHSKLAKHCKASGRNTARKPAWKYGTKRLEGQSDPKLSWPRCTSYDRNDTIHLISDLICAYIILHHLTSYIYKVTLSHLHRKTTKISQGLAWKNRASITEDSRRSVQRQFETS
jgi:hypothetical protein